MREGGLVTMAIVFASISFASVGGGTGAIAPMQHQAVEVQHWMDARAFVELFAISRAAPGPGSMLATLIGWKVDGWTGALVTTAAMLLPSSILCLLAIQGWNRYRGRAWHSTLQEGVAPVAAGLILAGALAVARTAETGLLAWAVAGATAVILTLRPRVPALLLIGGGASVFIAVRSFG
jgi:chromate transporter